MNITTTGWYRCSQYINGGIHTSMIYFLNVISNPKIEMVLFYFPTKLKMHQTNLERIRTHRRTFGKHNFTCRQRFEFGSVWKSYELDEMQSLRREIRRVSTNNFMLCSGIFFKSQICLKNVRFFQPIDGTPLKKFENTPFKAFQMFLELPCDSILIPEEFRNRTRDFPIYEEFKICQV